MNPVPVIDFKLLFENAPGLYLILTPDLHIVAASSAFLEKTQTEHNAVLGKKLPELIAGNAGEAAASLDYVLQYRRPHKMTVLKYILQGHNGPLSRQYREAWNTPVFNEENNIAYIVHHIIDEEENKKLQQQEEYALLVIGPDGCITSCNGGKTKSAVGTTSSKVPANFVIEPSLTTKSTNTDVAITADKQPHETRGSGTTYEGWYFDNASKKRLEQQVNHLAMIVEQSSDAILSRGIDQRIISWNKGAEALLGFTKEEAIGKTAKELGIIKISEEEVAVIQQEIIKNGKWTSERDFFHKNGSSFFGSFTANAVKDEKGEMSAVFFIVKDISLHKQLEEQLKKSNEELEEKVRIRTLQVKKREARFRALIENSNDIITLMDKDFKLLYRSPAATRVLGWTDEDMIGVEATTNIHPEDRDYGASVVKEVMANPGKMVNTRFRMLHKQGHYLWLEGTLTNLLHDTDIKAIVFNFRDITERVAADEKLIASEKQFRAALDNMLEGIQIHDFNWRYLYVNEALLNYTRNTRGELMGHTLIEKYPGIEQSELFSTLDHCMKQRVAMRLETEFVFPDGRRSDFMLSIQPHPEGLLILSVDVTKIRKAERALKEEQEKFARIVEISPGLIYSFRLAPDGSLSFPYASNVFEDIFGVPYEEAADNINLIMDAYLEEDKERLFSSILASARDMSAWHLQFRYNHPKKGLVWLEGNSLPTAVDDGSVLWHGVLTDVTERKLTEDKINEQNQRLKTLSDNLPEMMLFQIMGETFESRRFTYVSNTVTSLTGKSPEEIMKDPTSLYGLLDKEDIPAIMAAEQDSYNNLKGFNQEARFHDYKGRMHWLNIISTPRKLHNGQVVWDGFHLDITAKKIAEQELKRSLEEKQALAERLSVILNTLPANIALLDEKGFIIDVNDAWRNFADGNGAGEGNYSLGENYIDISNNAFGKEKKDGKTVAKGIRAVLKGEKKEFIFEYPCHSPTEERWFRMVVTPLQHRQFGGAVVMHIDISELRRLEQQRLNARMEEQKKISKAMLIGQEKERNFIGQELHDNVNQILAGTKIYLGLAGEKNPDIKEQIKYPLELLDSSMEEIRMLCHKMVTPLTDIALEELIRDLLLKLELGSAIKTEFVYAVPGEKLPDDLKINIYRIIQELINNIVKYAAAKNVSVTFTGNKQILEVVVTDDGKGFDTRKDRKGIGISNMINRVKSFNGEIEIKSAAGKGCVTRISFPG